jgi:predicted PurR-regulated permease PerM
LSGDKDSADPTLARRQSLRQRSVARFVLVIVLVFLALWLARDFLAPIGWAVVVAIATWPLYTRFASRFRHHERLAPLLFTLTAALVLVLSGGSILNAALVFGVGAIVMLVGDNVVWPALVRGTAQLPFLLAFVGIFGGLQVFGLLGLFVGPVIMVALLTVWREWLGSGAARNSIDS